MHKPDKGRTLSTCTNNVNSADVYWCCCGVDYVLLKLKGWDVIRVELLLTIIWNPFRLTALMWLIPHVSKFAINSMPPIWIESLNIQNVDFSYHHSVSKLFRPTYCKRRYSMKYKIDFVIDSKSKLSVDQRDKLRKTFADSNLHRM